MPACCSWSRAVRFAPAPRRAPRESIVPMINVVFLLLVFLLLTAEIAPAPPVQIVPPTADVARPAMQGAAVLHLPADGTVVFGSLAGPAAIAALPAGAEVEIRADARLPASRLAALLPQLAQAGSVRLVTVAP